MCTVSVIAQPGLLRLVSNRDELRSRPMAFPPTIATSGKVSVLAPTDSASGGTWIACNDLGLAVALLNVNTPEADSCVPPRSRGGIVPSLICYRTLDEVTAAAAALDTRLYAPFRLVAVQADSSDVTRAGPRRADVAADIPRVAADVHVFGTWGRAGRRAKARAVRANRRRRR